MQSKKYLRVESKINISAQEEEMSLPARASQEGLPRGGRIFYGTRRI